MSDTILAIIELDNYPEVVAQRAAWLARRTGAELKLLLCDNNTNLFTDSFVVVEELQSLVDDLRDSELKSLEMLRDSVATDDLKVTTSYSSEYPASECVLSHADEIKPLYVVKGTHYHRPAERAGMSDIDWQLIRKLPFPLWFVKPREFSETPTVVAAVDPTHTNDKPGELDQRIIEEARQMTAGKDARLLVLHTYQRLNEIGSRATWAVKPVKLPIDELDEKIREEHRNLLMNLTRSSGIDDSDVHQLPGRASELLPAFSRTHGADLLVMGAVSRTSLKQRLIGSTAQRTLDHVDCDVLIVHSPRQAKASKRAA